MRLRLFADIYHAVPCLSNAVVKDLELDGSVLIAGDKTLATRAVSIQSGTYLQGLYPVRLELCSCWYSGEPSSRLGAKTQDRQDADRRPQTRGSEGPGRASDTVSRFSSS